MSTVFNEPTGGSALLKKHTFIGTLVLLSGVSIATPGYSFGYGEQMLLSIKGISWADSRAFNGDWFNDFAPQPHIFFDVVTYIGETLSFLPGIYLVYYSASCVAFALATALLAHKWVPRELQYLQHLVNLLSVIGPSFLLGTFLTIHFQAVPNMAGACLAYLTVALFLTSNEKWAAMAMLATSILHLQHGLAVASIAVLLLLFGIVQKKGLIGIATALTVLIATSQALARDLLTGSSVIATEAAEIGSTGHLNVEVWGSSVVWAGIFVIGMSMMNFVLPRTHSRNWRLSCLWFVIAAAPVTGVIADLNNLEPFQSWSRSFFVYRYSMILAPFAVWAIVRLIAHAIVTSGVAWLLSLSLSILACHQYLVVPYSALPAAGELVALMTLAFILVLLKLVRRYPTHNGWVTTVCTLVLAIGVATVGVLEFGLKAPKIGYSANDQALKISQSMSMALDDTDVLAADPSIPWIRLLTRRAVVVDCKGAPYGAEPWREYVRRLNLLGVEKPNTCTGYKDLPLSNLLRLPQEVGATTVLLLPSDASYEEAKELLPIRWSSGGPNSWLIFDLRN